MIHKTIHINDWVADIFFCITKYDENVLERALMAIYTPTVVLNRMREIVKEDKYNTGFTYSNKDIRRSVVVIGKTTDASEFMHTFVHEVRHLTDDIILADNVNTRGETVAYLEGDIAKTLYPSIAKFICPCCRNKRVKINKALVRN